MLHLILGRSGTGKTEYIRELLCEKAMKEADPKLFLIVPDQFTFEYETAMLRKAGPRDSLKVKVLSFSRLAEAVFHEYGGLTLKRLDDSGRKLLVAMAIKECSDKLSVYSRSADKLTDPMLDAIDELKSSCITPAMLFDKAALAGEGLSDKIYEIALIYSAYEAMLQGSYIDPADDITHATALVRGKSFFEGATLVIDAFESFNKQKLEFISAAMEKAKDVYVCLCTDTIYGREASMFLPVSKTAVSLMSAARELCVETALPKIFTENHRTESMELQALEQSLFTSEHEVLYDDPKDIVLKEFRTVYEELEYAAATIRNHIIKGEYRYGDFALICRKPEKYFTSIESIFKKWQVPVYYSQPQSMGSEPLIRLIMSALRICCFGYRTEDILTLLKTGLTPLDSEDISKLENYVYTWKISGRSWTREFVSHPEGYGKKMDEKAALALEEINSFRRSITLPLERLSAGIDGKTGVDAAAAVFNFLEDLGVSERIKSNSLFYRQSGNRELADDALRVWKKLMSVLDQFVMLAGDRNADKLEFTELLGNVLSGEETRDIPVRLDNVIFGTPDAVMQSSPKVTFILGAVQGEFPYVPKDSGLLSDKDKTALKDLELPFNDDLEDITLIERFNTYRACVGASEKLYVTYHRNYGSDELAPSELVTDITRLFPSLRPKEREKESYYISTPDSAFSALAEHMAQNDETYATLKELLSQDESYKGRINAMERAVRSGRHRIEDRAISRAMFGENYFSASQIEAYHYCAFRYFCQYGLRARERKPAEINVMEYGTLMHYLFEHIFSSDFRAYEENIPALRAEIGRLIEEYAAENMGGVESLTNRDRYRFLRMAQTAETLILHVIEELRDSEFVPEHFELRLADGTPFPPLKVKTSAGTTVKVGGVIDRVDVYRKGDEKYVRVVDYKTGHKEFKLYDLLYGLNLQMLIYLASLYMNTDLKAAGVLYLPSSMPNVSAVSRLSEDQAAAEISKKMRMSGVVLRDEQIIRAMEKNAQAKFIPVGIKDNGKLLGEENALSSKEFEKVFSHIRDLVATMADRLMNGEIPAEPLMANMNACSRCPYGPVCLAEKDDRLKYNLKMKKDEVLNRIGEGVDENG